MKRYNAIGVFLLVVATSATIYLSLQETKDFHKMETTALQDQKDVCQIANTIKSRFHKQLTSDQADKLKDMCDYE